MNSDERQQTLKAVEQAVRDFFDAYQYRTPEATEKVKECIAEDFFGFGTGIDEAVRSRAEMLGIIDRDYKETPAGLTVTLGDLLVRLHTGATAGIMLWMHAVVPTDDAPVTFSFRYTMTWQRVGGEWRAVSGHASVPWSDQAEGEGMPTDALRAKAERLEKEVAERTADLVRSNRELEIEAALERIRRVTGEMTDPSDLIEVVKQIRREVEVLYGVGTLDVGIIQEADDENFRFWSIFDVTNVPDRLEQFELIYPKKPDPPHPMLDKLWTADGTYAVEHLDLNEMWQVHASLSHYVPHEADMLKVALDSGDMEQGWLSVSSIQDGRMYMGWPHEPPEELASVQPRFAGVLADAQKRVEELRKAQQMAREAEIALAVEKVRARATAMHRSEELADVALTLRNELQNLGISGVSSSTVYTLQDDGAYRIWDMAEIQGVDDSRVHLDFVFRPDDARGELYFNDILAADGYSSFHYEGERLRSIASWLKDHDPASADTMFRLLDDGVLPALWISSHPVERGFLSVDTVEPPSDELAVILPRMAAAFDLAYRRFEDLKLAEKQAREARIEAALERIRGRALAMRSSVEMIAVADELRRQVGLLGETDLEACAIHIYDTEGDDFESWGAIRDPEAGQEAISNVIRYFPKKGVAVLEDAIARYESDTDQYVIVNEGDQAVGFFEMMKVRAPEPYAAMMAQMPPEMKPWEMKAYWSMADFTGGSIVIVTFEPARQESLDLLRRAANVFDLAYRRFTDLRESEVAEREAHIEAALERVRSRSMAMQSSDELMDVAQVLFQQLIALGMDATVFETCGFVIFREGTNIGDTFLTQLDGSPLAFTFSAEYGGNRASQDHYAAWKEGKPIEMVHLVGDELPKHLDYLTEKSGKPINRFHEMAGVDVPPESFNYSANFKHGYIAVITTVPQEDAEELYPRFAKVFEQAYTRFLDLQRAESATREAEIETALERVRSRAMGMRNSDELLEVVATIHRQFSGLGLECGVFWHARYHEDHYEKALTAIDGSKVSTTMILPRNFSAVPELATWERGTEPFGVFQFDAEKGGQYMEHMISKGHFLEVDPNAVTPDVVRDHGGITFVQARTSSGEIGYSLWGEAQPEPEAREVLLRFARVFDLAHRRYEDLQEAEAAAREARIDAALERVRGQAMAMQKPEDISGVSIRMFEELEGLGIESLRSGIAIPEDGERYVFRSATKDEEGHTILVLGGGSIDVHPYIRRAYDGWKQQEPHQVTILEGDDLTEYYTSVFDMLPEPDQKARMQQVESVKEWFATFSFQDGWLYTFKREAYGPDELNLYERFARVFGLAYQRYHDLTKAEVDYKALLAEKARTERALTDLQATQKQLVEQEKLASLGSLTAGIAHEIKNPLNFVNNFAEVSQELVDELAEAIAAGDTEEAEALMADLRANAEQIAKHGGRADSIVKSMMQHARGGSAQRETVDVNAFIGEYIDLAWHGMRAKDHRFECEVIRDLDPEAGSFTVQSQDLGRVVLNLLNNAFYAVHMDGAAPKPSVRVKTGRSVDEKNVTIIVTDSGPGIPGNVLAKIFEPFFTTKPTGEGTGLGLSLSHDIVTKGHGGTMTVGTSKEGGAEFTITLPGGDA